MARTKIPSFVRGGAKRQGEKQIHFRPRHTLSFQGERANLLIKLILEKIVHKGWKIQT